MRSVQVTKPNGPFEIVERAIPEPGAGLVRIKVQACGICHSDVISVSGLMVCNFRSCRDMRWWARSMDWGGG